jgi:hypothetical protein
VLPLHAIISPTIPRFATATVSSKLYREQSAHGAEEGKSKAPEKDRKKEIARADLMANLTFDAHA